jgi:Orange carotenoid protein, N-terminal
MAIAFDTTIIQSPEVHSPSAVITATKEFKQLGADDRIALLLCVYAEVGQSISRIVQDTARLQLAKLLADRIKQMTYVSQLEVMRDLVDRVDTPTSRAYGSLSVNTKLCFWYVLADIVQSHIEIPISAHFQTSSTAQNVLKLIKELNCGQQITLLRNAVIDMGVDPELS